MAMLNNQRVRTLSEGTNRFGGIGLLTNYGCCLKKGRSIQWMMIMIILQKIILIQRPLKKRACLMMFNMNGGWD